MTIALWLLAIQGAIGAFDTLYYHEWRARLPARGIAAALELKLHAGRDFLYAVLFGTLPWVAWRGYWAAALLVIVAAEIVLTLWDFVAEIAVRKTLGDVYAGERITHAVMGITYGGMLAFMLPVAIISDRLEEFHTTEKKDGSGHYYHIKIVEAGAEKYALQLPRSGRTLGLDPYLIQLDKAKA